VNQRRLPVENAAMPKCPFSQDMWSRIEPMKKIARSLRDHREVILNYFRPQKLHSSGVVNGLNDEAKNKPQKSGS
jgi:transposase